MTAELVDNPTPSVEPDSASWRGLTPPRSVQPEDLARSPRSMIVEAQRRLWRFTGTEVEAVGPARRLIDDNGTKTFRTIEIRVRNLQIRLVSPFDDAVAAIWTTELDEGGEPALDAKGKARPADFQAWAYTRGATRPLDFPSTRTFLFGPWEDAMEQTGFVPAWKRTKAADAKRLSRPSVCPSCGAPVIVGIDQAFGEQQVAVDPAPLEGPLQTLAEAMCYLGRRGVYTAMKAGLGVELHRREDWHLGDDRWPVHVEHRCGDPLALP